MHLTYGRMADLKSVTYSDLLTFWNHALTQFAHDPCCPEPEWLQILKPAIMLIHDVYQLIYTNPLDCHHNFDFTSIVLRQPALSMLILQLLQPQQNLESDSSLNRDIDLEAPLEPTDGDCAIPYCDGTGGTITCCRNSHRLHKSCFCTWISRQSMSVPLACPLCRDNVLAQVIESLLDYSFLESTYASLSETLRSLNDERNKRMLEYFSKVRFVDDIQMTEGILGASAKKI
jgi:hypothetical protein